MRYFVTQIITVNGQTAIAVTEKSFLKEAKSLFYQILASAYANEGLEYILAYIENQDGDRELTEHYSKPVPITIPDPEPTPEPEPEPEENSEGLTTE